MLSGKVVSPTKIKGVLVSNYFVQIMWLIPSLTSPRVMASVINGFGLYLHFAILFTLAFDPAPSHVASASLNSGDDSSSLLLLSCCEGKEIKYRDHKNGFRDGAHLQTKTGGLAEPNDITIDEDFKRGLLASDKQITGSRPSIIHQRKKALTAFGLNSKRQLRGSSIPPNIARSKNLEVLDLSHNFLSGEIVVNLEEGNNLKSLHLGSNKLYGDFPSWLKNCTLLEILDLSYNGFVGQIPEWLGKCSSLKILNLRFNHFTGKIPTQLSLLSNLQVLDLAHNKFFGSIPRSLKSLKAMSIKHDVVKSIESGSGYYEEKVVISTKGWQFEFSTRVLTLINAIDLSCNNLTGEIPDGLTNLYGLKVLNLSYNQLGGPIPKNIGMMTELESLDVSSNSMSGELPTSLSNLTSLEHLNLSYNNFHGQIPIGTQLQGFVHSFDGNPELCGFPLQKCSPDLGPTNNSRNQEEEDESIFNISSLSVTMALGFVMGFWGAIGILMLNRSWRAKFFTLFDKASDSLLTFLYVAASKLAKKYEIAD